MMMMGYGAAQVCRGAAGYLVALVARAAKAEMINREMMTERSAPAGAPLSYGKRRSARRPRSRPRSRRGSPSSARARPHRRRSRRSGRAAAGRRPEGARPARVRRGAARASRGAALHVAVGRQHGDQGEALPTARRGTPRSSKVFERLGHVYMRTGELQMAIENFNEAMKGGRVVPAAAARLPLRGRALARGERAPSPRGSTRLARLLPARAQAPAAHDGDGERRARSSSWSSRASTSASARSRARSTCSTASSRTSPARPSTRTPCSGRPR